MNFKILRYKKVLTPTFAILVGSTVFLFQNFSPVTGTESSSQSCVATNAPVSVATSPLVFSVQYYRQYNPIRTAALSNDEAIQDWMNCGISLGLRAYPLFWTSQYIAYNPSNAYNLSNFPPGTTIPDAALQTYVTGGYGGGLQNYNSGMSGVFALGSEVFNIEYYRKTYPEAGSTDTEAEIYWVTHGLAAGQQAHPWFSASDYLFLNYDKALTYGSSGYQEAIDDYENRIANNSASVAGRETSFLTTQTILDLGTLDLGIPANFRYSASGCVPGNPINYCASYYLAQHPDAINYNSNTNSNNQNPIHFGPLAYWCWVQRNSFLRS